MFQRLLTLYRRRYWKNITEMMKKGSRVLFVNFLDICYWDKPLAYAMARCEGMVVDLASQALTKYVLLMYPEIQEAEYKVRFDNTLPTWVHREDITPQEHRLVAFEGRIQSLERAREEFVKSVFNCPRGDIVLGRTRCRRCGLTATDLDPRRSEREWVRYVRIREGRGSVRCRVGREWVNTVYRGQRVMVVGRVIGDHTVDIKSLVDLVN